MNSEKLLKTILLAVLVVVLLYAAVDCRLL